MSKVFIIMGSKSDWEQMKKAKDVLEENGIQADMHVASAHRNPEKVAELAKEVNKNYDIVIAGAGLAAHLPGVMASLVHKPVIGVPIESGALKGMDSLLAIVQMPPGVPVATVAVNGAKNAGILAMQILGLGNPDIAEKNKAFKKALAG